MSDERGRNVIVNDFDAGSPVADTGKGPLASEVGRLADAIAACDRLCLLTARSIIVCSKDGRFAPSVTYDTQDAGDDDEEGPPSAAIHPTTSAQCVTALQALLPIIGRFQLGTHESKDVAFHPIDRTALKVLEPGNLRKKIRRIIEAGLEVLIRADAVDEAEARNGGVLTLRDRVPPSLKSTTFGNLHPFTAAQILRAIAPSTGMYQTVWWRSLFVVLWFLNRRGGSLGGYPNTNATNSPGTAFLTSKCIDALEGVLLVLARRRDRLRKLTDLMNQLNQVVKEEKNVRTNHSMLNQEMFCAGYKYEASNLIREIRFYADQLAIDTVLRDLYAGWKEKILRIPEDNKEAKTFLESVVSGFIEARDTEKAEKENKSATEAARRNLAFAKATSRVVSAILEHVVHPTGRLRASWDPRELPDWTCSRGYRAATVRAVKNPEPSNSEGLERHWTRHKSACDNAVSTLEVFHEYLGSILTAYREFPYQPIDGRPEVEAFLEDFSRTTHISRLRQRLSRDKEIGVRWAEILMNRHLAYAANGAMTQFDPNELAHAVQVVCKSERQPSFDAILGALRAVCAAQRVDGTWASQQPFYWTHTGFSTSPLSVETARAVVSTATALLRAPERFGASPEQIAQGLGAVYPALDRFLRWLSGSIQSFPTPQAFTKTEDAGSELPLYGWCSERAYEPGRIHPWVTANAIEFLIEFRELIQERINLKLRAEFLSYHPAELKRLSDVAPTDLDSSEPIISELGGLLRHHRQLEVTEGPWLPFETKASEDKSSFWSAIFYGPPGTSKTFLTKAIAGELGWPLITLSPADFLKSGEQNIESRAQEIFSSLSKGSKLVYFFDEVDELIRDRAQMGDQERSVFSFLTPSFLTKLQDFREEAKKREYIFIIGTNYLDNIDPAARRSGRIDRQWLIAYPDNKSRAHIMIKDLISLNFLHQPLGKATFAEEFVNCTGFLSYNNLKELNSYVISVCAQDKDKLNPILNDHLYNISVGRSGRFKPEIALMDYACRSNSADEVIRLASLFPKWPFPSGTRSKVSRNWLKEEFSALFAVANEELRKSLKDELRRRIKEEVPDALREFLADDELKPASTVALS
jgi:hypothetical protein